MADITVEIVYAPSNDAYSIKKCSVSAHANVAMAIRRSGMLQEYKELKIEDLKVGIYGKKVALDELLNDGDRIEIYRPLVIDPMAARRLRVKKKN